MATSTTDRGAVALPGVTVARRLRAFWRRIEPGVTVSRSCIERWDACGEDEATAISFEGFGLSFCLFVGRTPAFRPYEDNERAAKLARWYAGESSND